MSHLYPPYLSYIQGRRGFGVWARKLRDSFSLLKLHGSSNWFYSGQPDFHGETILYTDVPAMGSNSAQHDANQRKLVRDKAPLLIPPVTEKTTYFKNESVSRLWWEAASALQLAERVYLMGYSLPPSDIGMTFFLATILRDHEAEIHVVNIDASVASRLKELLGHSTIKDDFVFEGYAVAEFVEAYCEERSRIAAH